MDYYTDNSVLELSVINLSFQTLDAFPLKASLGLYFTTPQGLSEVLRTLLRVEGRFLGTG